MPKFGAHAFGWISDWSVEAGNHAIHEAGRTGLDFIEIPLLKPYDFDAPAAKRALTAAGIYATASTVLPRDSHMPDEPEKAKRFLFKCLDGLEAVGGTYLCGCIGFAHGLLKGRAPEQWERDVVAETLAAVAEEAGRRGMSLALETCNRYETYLYNTLEDAQATVLAVRALGCPNIEVHGDTYQMNVEEEGWRKPILATADTLGYMHLSESHRGLVGTGTINWDAVFQALADIHYTGPLALESFAAINKDLIAATCLWRPVNATPDELATKGLAFMREYSAKYGLS